MRKSYRAVALAILVGCLAAVSTADAQGGKQKVSKLEKGQTSKPKMVREGVGFDGIAVGKSTEADVVKKFGKNYKLKTHKKYSRQLIYPNGMSFYVCQSDKRRQIFDIELRAPFEAQTTKGIAIGKSTLEDIHKIYGKNRDGGLQYRGVSFYYKKTGGKNVVTVIDIVENSGIRQCDSVSSPKSKNK
ncbi:MAG TPA: hypothetical protein VIL74_07400 [Pyrinomonadaceae bacterium]|jgi:hypothetical protein